MKALLVMDMQEGCVGENANPYFKYESNVLIDNVNNVIKDNRDAVVIYIRNLLKKSLISKLAPVPIYDGSAEAELVNSLDIVSDHIFDKYAGDAFTNPKLVSFLKEKDVDEILLVGVDGGGCVALTALGAIKNGYKVTLVQKAIGTMFDRQKDKYFKKLAEQGADFI